jgi:hypothetical protein
VPTRTESTGGPVAPHPDGEVRIVGVEGFYYLNVGWSAALRHDQVQRPATHAVPYPG